MRFEQVISWRMIRCVDINDVICGSQWWTFVVVQFELQLTRRTGTVGCCWMTCWMTWFATDTAHVIIDVPFFELIVYCIVCLFFFLCKLFALTKCLALTKRLSRRWNSKSRNIRCSKPHSHREFCKCDIKVLKVLTSIHFILARLSAVLQNKVMVDPWQQNAEYKIHLKTHFYIRSKTLFLFCKLCLCLGKTCFWKLENLHRTLRFTK